MTISVITPSFQQGQFIEKTIQSVFNQQISNANFGIEYFVIDGGSTDQTLAILQKYQHRLSWISEPDEGQSHAVNKGLAMSTGEIIAWINSDDIYYPRTFERVLSFFEANPEVVVVYGQADWIDETDAVIDSYPTQPWNYRQLTKECYLCQPAVFFRRSVMERFGSLESRLQYCMDYELWLRYGKAVPFAYLPTKLAGSRVYASNKTFGHRLAAHQEANCMLKARLGYSTRHWIFEYSKLQLSSDDLIEERSFVFLGKLMILSAINCWKFNRNAVVIVVFKVVVDQMLVGALRPRPQAKPAIENIVLSKTPADEDLS